MDSGKRSVALLGRRLLAVLNVSECALIQVLNRCCLGRLLQAFECSVDFRDQLVHHFLRDLRIITESQDSVTDSLTHSLTQSGVDAYLVVVLKVIIQKLVQNFDQQSRSIGRLQA